MILGKTSTAMKTNKSTHTELNKQLRVVEELTGRSMGLTCWPARDLTQQEMKSQQEV
jgi:hypothetical protein